MVLVLITFSAHTTAELITVPREPSAHSHVPHDSNTADQPTEFAGPLSDKESMKKRINENDAMLELSV
jgi:hypothetical protein